MVGLEEELLAHVRLVLRRIWNPVGLGEDAPEDEYEAYLPALVGLTFGIVAFEDAIASRLSRIEVEEMRLSLEPAGRTRAARALLGLRAARHSSSGRLAAQIVGSDGMRCLWIFERPTGLFAYEEVALVHEHDENGRWSWWADAGAGRSGLFETPADAERDARASIGWLRDAGAPADQPA